jgi:hypothetical protein
VRTNLQTASSEDYSGRVPARVDRSFLSMNDNNLAAVRLSFCFLLATLFSPGVYGQANHVVLSEVYGGGGNSGSTWKNDFVELYNPTNVPVDVTGWSHHKYAVIDAELTTVAQYVITGSHNWTSAAESSNNENTLIIQSNSIANQYLQDFVARYKSAGGSDNIVVNVERIGDQTPRSLSLAQNCPNPFNGTTNLNFRLRSSDM